MAFEFINRLPFGKLKNPDGPEPPGFFLLSVLGAAVYLFCSVAILEAAVFARAFTPSAISALA